MRRRQGRKDRKHRRFDVSGITGNLQFSAEVAILNISAGGMQVKTHSHLSVGRRYTFQLRRGERNLKVGGHVVWCVLRGTERLASGEMAPSYGAGIAFEHTLTDEGRALADFIREEIVVQPEVRLFGRLQVEAERRATADINSELVVRRISVSGMQVESELTLAPGQEFPVELRLGEEAVTIVGRVVAVVEAQGEQGSAEVEIEFVDPTAEQREALARFIEAEFCDVDTTVGGE